MRFRVGCHMQRKKENILWYFWLRSSWNFRREWVRHERGYVVHWGAGLRAFGGEGSLLSHKSQVDHEKDNERQFCKHLVPCQPLQKRNWLHQKTSDQAARGAHERQRCVKTPIFKPADLMILKLIIQLLKNISTNASSCSFASSRWSTAARTRSCSSEWRPDSPCPYSKIAAAQVKHFCQVFSGSWKSEEAKRLSSPSKS
jgi:hypothetical protein